MSEELFLDTNVVLYLLAEDAAKADRAETLLGRNPLVSVQVLNEAATVCRRKLHMPWDEVEEFLQVLKTACRVVPLSLEVHELGVALAQSHQLSFYDALICAAANLAGASTLMSEDMAHGQQIGEVRVHNPFV